MCYSYFSREYPLLINSLYSLLRSYERTNRLYGLFVSLNPLSIIIVDTRVTTASAAELRQHRTKSPIKSRKSS